MDQIRTKKFRFETLLAIILKLTFQFQMTTKTSNVQNHNQNARRRIIQRSAFLSPVRMRMGKSPLNFGKNQHYNTFCETTQNHRYGKEILWQLSQCGCRCGLPHYSSKFCIGEFKKFRTSLTKTFGIQMFSVFEPPLHCMFN